MSFIVLFISFSIIYRKYLLIIYNYYYKLKIYIFYLTIIKIDLIFYIFF